MIKQVATLPDTLRLGTAELRVTDLGRSLAFYESVLGLRVHRRVDGRASLGGGGEDVLVLVEEPQARPQGRHAGLYHVAVLYASREELARSVRRIAATGTPISGASDHGTHEAVYLPDPDGIELELAADRPREQWPDVKDVYALGPRPLDLAGLAEAAGEPRTHADPATRVGHVHLFVGDVDEADRFYGDVLGFDRQLRMPTATFLSAGGYHHHVAANVWRGEGIPPAPDDVVGLRHWTILLEDPADVDAVAERVLSAGREAEERDDGVLVRDPWNIAALVTAGTPARDG